jgi:hypothetical protein
MLGKSAAVEVDATEVERVSVGRLRADLDVQVNPIPTPTNGQTEISPA